MTFRSDKSYYDSLKSFGFSDTTKKLYTKRLKFVQKNIWKAPIHRIFMNPLKYSDKLRSYIEDSGLSRASEMSYLAPFSAFGLHDAFLKQNRSKTVKLWKELMNEVSSVIDEKIDENKPKKRITTTWEKVLDIRDRLDISSQVRLLFEFYTLIPPLRLDYFRIKITDKPSKTENVLVLDATQSTLILNTYKTRRVYGVLTVELPEKLNKFVLLSLATQPRNFLFTNSKNQPYATRQSFAGTYNKRLKKLTGDKNFSIGTFRHLYISNMFREGKIKTRAERRRVARIMGHSLDMQDKYKWI